MITDFGTTLDTTKSSSTTSDLNFEGKTFSDDQTKANILNNYFKSALADESEKLGY